jgi:Uma2 family endonuclease
MAIASQSMTLADYLNFDDGTDTLYELVDGELWEMPPESELNRRIASGLFAQFVLLGLPPSRLTMKTEIVVSGTGVTVRLPDLMVLSEALAIALAGARRSTILPEMPPPDLVVEIVSPGKQNEDQDYRYKRSQYQARGIPEYWIIDPIRHRITVLTLREGLYEDAVFTGTEAIASRFLQTCGQTTPWTTVQLLVR